MTTSNHVMSTVNLCHRLPTYRASLTRGYPYVEHFYRQVTHTKSTSAHRLPTFRASLPRGYPYVEYLHRQVNHIKSTPTIGYPCQEHPYHRLPMPGEPLPWATHVRSTPDHRLPMYVAPPTIGYPCQEHPLP